MDSCWPLGRQVSLSPANILSFLILKVLDLAAGEHKAKSSQRAALPLGCTMYSFIGLVLNCADFQHVRNIPLVCLKGRAHIFFSQGKGIIELKNTKSMRCRNWVTGCKLAGAEFGPMRSSFLSICTQKLTATKLPDDSQLTPGSAELQQVSAVGKWKAILCHSHSFLVSQPLLILTFATRFISYQLRLLAPFNCKEL